jgi:hypothetical protein
MPAGRIPPQVVQQWDKLKKELVPWIEKAKDKKLDDPAYKKQVIASVNGLYATFDKGLKATLKKASTAKDDATAKKALQEVGAITMEYIGRLNHARKNWPEDGKGVADTIEKRLTEVRDAAAATLKSMG